MSRASEADSVVFETIMKPSTKVRFYIPTEKPGADEIVEDVVLLLADRFGGATKLPAKGAYVMEDGDLCYENVALVESFATNMKVSDLTQLALQIKEELGEEAVAFETDTIETAFV